MTTYETIEAIKVLATLLGTYGLANDIKLEAERVLIGFLKRL